MIERRHGAGSCLHPPPRRFRFPSLRSPGRSARLRVSAISATIADLSARARIPSCGYPAFAQDGGLGDFGVNSVAMFRRAGFFVDRLLKGAKPAELPFERATRFEMTINLKTAKTIGLEIPQQVLLRADKVIE
ncbi:MAG: ABC transporter substrate binding protein [Betaproteobacteria bacterium]